jgi:N-acetylglucosaminyl-diphospho-decaprenol L-rhamnosyltransferase
VISILAVLYHSETTLAETLPSWADAARQLPPGDAEIRVWANDDADYETLFARYEWGAISVHVERGTDNIGFAAGMNTLAAQSDGEWVLLLNPDITVEPTTFADLVAWTAAHPGVLGAVPMRTDNVDHAGIAVGAFLFFRDRPTGGGRHLPLVGPSGGAGLFPVEAWKQAGGLWERFFAWGEDVDLALRLWKAGWTTQVVPIRPLHHAGGHSVASIAGQRRKARLLARNRIMVWARMTDPRLAALLAPAWASGAVALCALHVTERTGRATVSGVIDGLRAWRPARQTTDPVSRLGLPDWRQLWQAS